MFARLLLVCLLCVLDSVFSGPPERPGLRRRRSSSECAELVSGVAEQDALSESMLGFLSDSAGRIITDPYKMHVCLKREIERLSIMKKTEALHIQELRAEISGITGPIMRILNRYASGVEPEEMITLFEEQQLIIAFKLKSLREAFSLVEGYLLMQKKK